MVSELGHDVRTPDAKASAGRGASRSRSALPALEKEVDSIGAAHSQDQAMLKAPTKVLEASHTPFAGSSTPDVAVPLERGRSSSPSTGAMRGRQRERARVGAAPVALIDSPTRIVATGTGTPPRSHVGPTASLVSDNRTNMAAITDATARGELMSRDGTPANPNRENEAGKSSGFFSSVLNVAQNLGSSVLSNGASRSPLSLLSSRTVEDHKIRSSAPESSAARDEAAGTVGLSLKDMGIEGAPVSQSKHQESLCSTEQRGDTLDRIESGSLDVVEPQARSGSVADGSYRTRRRSSTGHSLSGLLESYGQAPKITGFAVASNKRNRDFHALFRSVPDNDYLLDDYGCALQREILIQGRMYVSEAHLCFNSNIFGWVTNLVVAFADVTAIEKRSTAGIFPNAIQISTPHAKHIFASFISRDSVFDLLVNIWKLGHPNVQTTTHGVEAVHSAAYEASDTSSDHETLSGSDDVQPTEASDSEDRMSVNSFAVGDGATSTHEVGHATAKESREASVGKPGAPSNAPTISTEHAPTEAPALSDGTMLKTELLDEQVALPLETTYSLVFGEDSSFMREFLEHNQKLVDVNIDAFKSSTGPRKSRKVVYVKPLSGPIGPKQTRCLVEQTIERYERDAFAQILETTTTPDVPSGDAFSIKTRYCFMWGQQNRTRLAIHCDVVWTKSSWIKSVIDKSAVQGQVEYGMALVEALRAKAATSSGDDKFKRRRGAAGKRGRGAHASAGSPRAGSPILAVPTPEVASEGMFGFVSHINVNLLLFVMLGGMLISMWRMQQSIRTLSSDRSVHQSAAGLRRWKDEEYTLWTWLASERPERESSARSSAAFQERSSTDSLVELQLSELIKQTDERLALLREAQRLQSQRARVASGSTERSEGL